MFAVIKTGGKQYRVENNDVLYIEKLDAEDGATVEFDVIAMGDENGIQVGSAVKGKVTAEVIKSGKGKKIYVETYKPKKGEKRKIGHRQPYTKVEIKSIG